MSTTLLFIFGIIAGAIVVSIIIFFIRAKKRVGQSKDGLIEMQAKEKEINKKKILDMLSSRDRIANIDVENGLNVSDATATRYLDKLEEEGILRQVGKDGRFVYYEKV